MAFASSRVKRLRYGSYKLETVVLSLWLIYNPSFLVFNRPISVNPRVY